MENKIPDIISNKLMEILLNNKDAQLLLTGYATGKGISNKVKIIGEFTIIDDAGNN